MQLRRLCLTPTGPEKRCIQSYSAAFAAITEPGRSALKAINSPLALPSANHDNARSGGGWQNDFKGLVGEFGSNRSSKSISISPS